MTLLPLKFCTQGFYETANSVLRKRVSQPRCLLTHGLRDALPGLSPASVRSCSEHDPSRGGCAGGIAPRRVVDMDVVSMIMGASIASVVWITLVPWAKLKRLKELEDGEKG